MINFFDLNFVPINRILANSSRTRGNTHYLKASRAFYSDDSSFLIHRSSFG